MDVRLKKTSTKPSFLMPFTNPDFDVDVSASMVNGGAVEMGLSQVTAVDIASSFALSNPARGSHPSLYQVLRMVNGATPLRWDSPRWDGCRISAPSLMCALFDRWRAAHGTALCPVSPLRGQGFAASKSSRCRKGGESKHELQACVRQLHPTWCCAPQVWYFRLKDQCVKADGSRRLVVDVGANFGWYSLFAAAMGCRCVSEQWARVAHEFTWF